MRSKTSRKTMKRSTNTTGATKVASDEYMRSQGFHPSSAGEIQTYGKFVATKTAAQSASRTAGASLPAQSEATVTVVL